MELLVKSWPSGSPSSCSSSAVSNIAWQTVGYVCHSYSLGLLIYRVTVLFGSLGLMYGAPSTIGRLFYNQSAAVLGNLIGGAIFIGLAAHLSNHWKSPFFSSSDGGTLLGHDLESTRRAREGKKLEAGLLESGMSTRHYHRRADAGEIRNSSLDAVDSATDPRRVGGPS